MVTKKSVSDNKEEKGIPYQDKVNLFNKRVQEFRDVIAFEQPSVSSEPNLSFDAIINTIDPNENDPYFSLSYFYEGLRNTLEISKGNNQSIKFLWLVIISIMKEKSLRTSDNRLYGYLKSLLTKVYTYHIKEVGGQYDLHLSLDDYQKNFVQEKLPYLINKDEIQKIKHELNKMADELDKKEKYIDDKIVGYQKKAEELVKFIKEQNTKLNFVGLGSAFQTINDEKRSAKRWIIFFLSFLFLGLLGIPWLTYSKVYCTEQPNYFMAIPFTVVEFILLYVFRLFYQQFTP